jgi:hypothetical protein
MRRTPTPEHYLSYGGYGVKLKDRPLSSQSDSRPQIGIRQCGEVNTRSVVQIKKRKITRSSPRC